MDVLWVIILLFNEFYSAIICFSFSSVIIAQRLRVSKAFCGKPSAVYTHCYQLRFNCLRTLLGKCKVVGRAAAVIGMAVYLELNRWVIGENGFNSIERAHTFRFDGAFIDVEVYSMGNDLSIGKLFCVHIHAATIGHTKVCERNRIGLIADAFYIKSSRLYRKRGYREYAVLIYIGL